MLLVLIWTVHLGAAAVVGPSTRPASAALVAEILLSHAPRGKKDGAFLPPTLLEELVRGGRRGGVEVALEGAGCRVLRRLASGAERGREDQ